MARINYQEWSRINLSVSNIRLDRENPRIPSYSAIRNQTDIISYMFEHEKILRLAAKITEKGFICHDPIYVVKEGDYYTVVEGNRRITALKCLIDPDLAPTVQARNRLSIHKNNLGIDLIEKIEVYVAPSRHDVENVLFELHAEGKVQWNRQQKNKFIAGVGLKNGESIDDIAKRFNVAPSEISQAVTEYLIELYIPELSLPTDIESLALKQKLNVSTLSRFINNSHFTKITGFTVNNNRIITTASRDIFNYLLSEIITDIINKKIDSRTHNDSETIKKYIEAAIKRYSGPTDTPPVEYSPPTVDTTTTQSEPKEKSKRKNKETLIPKGNKYETGCKKLDVLIEEAQGMLIDTHKTANALLLRTIIELSVVRLFEVNNKREQCLNDKGRIKNLSDNLAVLCNRENWFQDKGYYIDLKRFTDKGSTSWGSIESLNRYAHGEFLLPDRELLRQVWMIIKPLLDMIKETTLKNQPHDV